MVERQGLRDEQFQDYLDGRLSDGERADLEAYLRAHPEAAAEVEQLRRQNEALRGVGQEILEEPIPDRLRDVLRGLAKDILEEPVPSRLRDVLERAPQLGAGQSAPAPEPPAAPSSAPAAVPAAAVAPRRSRLTFIEVAAAFLLFFAGATCGWVLNGRLQPAMPSSADLAMQLAHAFDFYKAEPGYPPDFPAERGREFTSLLGRSFVQPIEPPDLRPYQFANAGGRIAPLGASRVGLFEFENPGHARLGLFFWRSDAEAPPPLAVSDQAGVATRFWTAGDLTFALLGDLKTPEFEQIAAAIETFYRDRAKRP